MSSSFCGANETEPEPPRSPPLQPQTAPPSANECERKGERRRKRHERTKLRHALHAEQAAKNATCPKTSSEAAERWNAFYLTKSSLYKDRHLLRSQLVDAVSPSVAADPSVHVAPLHEQQRHAAQHARDLLLVEAGCGAGASVYPLLRANPRLHVIAFDISDQAIRSLQRSPEYSPDRVTAFVADAARTHSFLPAILAVRPRGAHFVTAVWTLSALPPRACARAVRGLAAAVAPGGKLYVRDYAHGDMRERMFADAGRRVDRSLLAGDDGASETGAGEDADGDGESRLFLRGDGTYAYFFTVDEVRKLFTAHGLDCISCVYEERAVHNRKLGMTMNRRWIVGHFRKAGNEVEDCDLSMGVVVDGGVHDCDDV